MNYYIDTEFLEGTQKSLFGKTKPTIDLISIGIVSGDNRKFYAVSKDFNLKEAWYRWQQRTGEGDRNNIEPRHYWIRENVLKPIFEELANRERVEENKSIVNIFYKYGYKELKRLINKYGYTNEEIAFNVVNFIHGYNDLGNWLGTTDEYYNTIVKTEPKEQPKFYGYYADYDWVAFCWLFGKMIDLPIGFPMYCIDLKQTLDSLWYRQHEKHPDLTREEAWVESVKSHPNYPKETNEHHALKDAEWNKRLHEFLQTL